jgi:putative tryptophan/tyrosine transport system substrate-binding protein
MRRRDFIALLGGAAAARPLRAHAEEPDRVRRIGVLNALAESNPQAHAWEGAFSQRLAELGWSDGRNIRVDYRRGATSVDRLLSFARELVSLKPDLLVAMTTPATAALQAATHSIPIVFAAVSDPIGSGFVKSLASPGGNITGFIDIEASLSGKWLELMRAVAPRVSHVALLFNPQTAPFARYYQDTFRAAAPAFAVEPIEAPVRSTAEAEAVVTKLGREGSGGLILMPDASMWDYGETIFAATDRFRMPTICPTASLVAAGGLLSYGIDFLDLQRGAASYADRILRGAKPSELPVQLPTKFELAINLKTAKALGLSIPPSLIATADEVIE